MNQHVATNHKIKASIVTKGFGCPFLKHNPPKSGAVSALPSLRYDRRIRVNPNNRTIRSDKLSRQDGNITCAGAHVENPHTGPDSGISEKTLRDRPQNCGLRSEATDLSIRMAQNIGDVIAGYHQSSTLSSKCAAKAVRREVNPS
jgi:hypothetical protein